jgi:predicted  nucleic acid-binding Zn-ribbon protein
MEQVAQDVFSLADRLKELRERKSELNEEIKAVNAELEEVEAKLAEAMVAEEIQNFARNGQMYYLQSKVYASAVPERKQELYEWLKENGYGDLVYETVNANSLAAFVREQLEESDELPEGLSELVNVYEETTVGIRKAPAKKK